MTTSHLSPSQVSSAGISLRIEKIYQICQFFLFQTDVPQISKMVAHTSQPIGSMLYLTCNVIKGLRPFQFQWFKDNHQLMMFGDEGGGNENTFHNNNNNNDDSDNKFMIESKSSISHLTIAQIDTNDSGNYSCIVSNKVGFDTQWSILQVKGLIYFIV